ncbi:hypothetical protein [Mycolicibacterium mengxianglii]|uniref:hypothetical protein n=1 Tax=Mycolicibacterium mengxianglii TaxID=2736649 RepID=UPI0018D19028|nr:hypothetical protein [Mycolicibacterium mengxianglii]
MKKSRPVGSYAACFWVRADYGEPGHAAAFADYHHHVVQSHPLARFDVGAVACGGRRGRTGGGGGVTENPRVHAAAASDVLAAAVEEADDAQLLEVMVRVTAALGAVLLRAG